MNPLPGIIRPRQTHLPGYRYASSDEDVLAAGVPTVIVECIGNRSDSESARRAEGLGRNAGITCGFSQAVRSAGKRFPEYDTAEVHDLECQYVPGGLAPGIAAEMAGGLKVS